ncbi:MAG TPA: BamA/TamA family outer membrane protein [Vicinamibacterales bacterium]|nr:BamA/TamA family outer membrane protein [Vicinamibacterales bacterium]
MEVRAQRLAPARLGRILGATLLALAIASPVSAQYFGRNKVQFDRFKFRVLTTPHFDIYFYPEEAEAATVAGRIAERWYTRLSRVFDHQLSSRQPLILYASHPDFAQTNVIEGFIGEGTGGVTEGLLRRITLPLGASLAQSDHVIGHELVHAFQFDILGRRGGALPLWFIEGMAEYLTIGVRDPQTAMWLRDAALMDALPRISDLDNPNYFPYRWGHALWAYLGGRWGDEIVGTALHRVADPLQQTTGDPVRVIQAATGATEEELSAAWHAAIRRAYGISATPEARAARSTAAAAGDAEVVIGDEEAGGRINVGPALSPDGTRIAFLSERGQLSVNLYLADAATGRVTRELISTAVDPHFESLQFLMSAGSWRPDGQALAVATLGNGRPAIAVIDARRGSVVQEIPFPDLGEVFHPDWSPDGTRLAFAAQVNGFTDLFVHDLNTGSTTRLTDDAFSDLQPSWSPDGRAIVFVSDRFSTDTERLTYGTYGLVTIDPAARRLTRVETGLRGNALDPTWIPGTRQIAFISDSSGRPEAYRVDAGGGTSIRIATALTGIAGITPLSPALSVSADGSRIAYSVFREGGFDIHIASTPRTAVPDPAGAQGRAELPPTERERSDVDAMLRDATTGLTGTASFETVAYKPRLALVDIGQQVGFATAGALGSFVTGGISMTFSDVLGNHLLATGLAVNGEFQDLGGQVLYVNRSSRWNWGVFGDRVPYVSAGVASGFIEQNGDVLFVEQVSRDRQTYHRAGGLVAYPFSRAFRVEFSAAAQHIGFSREIQTLIADPATGRIISDETTDLPSTPSLRLVQLSAAAVRDTAAFGFTGPILGQRIRLAVDPTFGDLELYNVTADVRQYVMPVRPVTIAARVMHFGRYGNSAESERLVPLYLGYPELVRGYDANSFEAGDCSVTTDGSCPEFDRLLGSRVLVLNLEARAPLVGLFRGRLDYGPVPVDVFAFFDAGSAWSKGRVAPIRAEGDWVTSVGGGARFNAFGFAVLELNLVRPLQRPGRGWMFVFNLRPGF